MQRKLEGNRGHRPLNKSEPKFENAACEVPGDFDETAKKELLRIFPILSGSGILTEADIEALYSYCRLYSTVIMCQRNIKRYRLFRRNKKTGELKVNPAVNVRDKAMQQMRQFMIEFGMTPASRTKLSVEPPASEADPTEKIINSGIKHAI